MFKIRKTTIVVNIRLKCGIKLFCCWYHCCFQTPTFHPLHKWIKFSNQMSRLFSSRFEWISCLSYLL